MVVPEFRWPITPTTFASTSFCAAAVPCLGSAPSSSEISVKVTFFPSILISALFKSATASLAPASLSFPRWAMEPVSGPTWPILTVESLGAQPATATAIAAALVRSTFLATEAFTRVANMQISRGRKKGGPGRCCQGQTGASVRIFQSTFSDQP